MGHLRREGETEQEERIRRLRDDLIAAAAGELSSRAAAPKAEGVRGIE